MLREIKGHASVTPTQLNATAVVLRTAQANRKYRYLTERLKWSIYMWPVASRLNLQGRTTGAPLQHRPSDVRPARMMDRSPPPTDDMG